MTMTGFVPIYPGGDRAGNEIPTGYIVGFIELDGMVASFLNQNLIYAGFGLRAFDGATPIFSAGPSAAAAPKIPLLIGDREWQLQIVAPGQQAASVVWLPSLIFFFGLALTGLLYLYFVRSDSEYARVAARVRLATGQLEAANQELELRSERLEALAVDLRRTSEEAQLASAAKTMFLANMSHELRTPLNAVIGFSEVISNQLFGASSPRYADYAKDIHSSGEHLLGIIEGLLDMSRVELGMLQLDDKSIRLSAVVEDAVRFTNHRAQEQKVAVRREGLETLPHITGDARALRQIFINLLTNAIKFSVPRSAVNITGNLAADGGIVLRVVDHGCGIAPENLEHIFEPFWHSDAHLSHTKDGVGLGLAITRRLVEAHGGEIDVVSEADIGTTISMHLPATRVIRDAEITALD
jgi:signal transduction histidine kinase